MKCKDSKKNLMKVKKIISDVDDLYFKFKKASEAMDLNTNCNDTITHIHYLADTADKLADISYSLETYKMVQDGDLPYTSLKL